MPRNFTLWLTLSTFTLLVNVAWTDECLRSGLRPIDRNKKQPTACLMDCTMRTFIKYQRLRHRSPVQFKDSMQGDHGVYCWPVSLHPCRQGQSIDRVFVVLPVNFTTAEEVEVGISPAATKLSVHRSLPLVPDECGLLYDVTEHFNTENSESSFCIQLSSQQSVPAHGALRCPPYLVVFWQTDSNQAHVQSGG